MEEATTITNTINNNIT
jgi:hypothetical protein